MDDVDVEGMKTVMAVEAALQRSSHWHRKKERRLQTVKSRGEDELAPPKIKPSFEIWMGGQSGSKVTPHNGI